jgi:hypothetical protein
MLLALRALEDGCRGLGSGLAGLGVVGEEQLERSELGRGGAVGPVSALLCFINMIKESKLSAHTSML